MASSNGGLLVQDTITVETEDGPRLIQLLFGDITKLPPEDKVDVLLVSAFASDYAATRTSVIGALKYNLNISVRDLAANKKEDLRRNFHCWQSHPLPTHLPYGEIVCFETPVFRGFRHPAELVGDVFRALISMFQNQERSVITPLLSTGDQNYSRTVMLQAMLDAAINWMQTGLAMTCLKIVLYKQDLSRLSSDEKQLIGIFSKNKQRVETMQKAKQAQADAIKFDVYLSFSEQDREQAGQISKLMLASEKKLRIFSEEQLLKSETAFQEDILRAMQKCHRVVTILTPAFLSSADCLEKYNLALCVNRQSQKNILAPFYVETIITMPTYMTLVQYVDVRDRDGTNQRMLTGVETFVTTLKLTVQISMAQVVQYDVFISYSHRNTEEATHLMKVLQKLDPNLRIFYDRNELKTGFSWQQTLYNAIDNSRVVVTLMSPDYLTSTVCIEEYSLALCRHLTETGDKKLQLVPVKIQPFESLPRSLAEVPLIDGVKDYQSTALEIAQAITKFSTGTEVNMNVFNKVKVPLDLLSVLSSSRARSFHKRYDVQVRNISRKGLDYEALQKDSSEYKKTATYKEKVEELENLVAAAKLEKDEAEKKLLQPESHDVSVEERKAAERKKKTYNLDKVYDVAFVCADYLQGTFLNSLLFHRAPQIETNFEVDSEEAEMTALEKARLCVIFLSPRLITIRKDMEEVDVALARQRKSEQKLLYPIAVSKLTQRPTFCQLLPYQVALNDSLWVDLMCDSRFTSVQNLPEDVVLAHNDLTVQYEEGLDLPTMLGLSVACDDIISILQGTKASQEVLTDPIINNIVSLHLGQGAGEDEKVRVPVKILGSDLTSCEDLNNSRTAIEYKEGQGSEKEESTAPKAHKSVTLNQEFDVNEDRTDDGTSIEPKAHKFVTTQDEFDVNNDNNKTREQANVSKSKSCIII